MDNEKAAEGAAQGPPRPGPTPGPRISTVSGAPSNINEGADVKVRAELLKLPDRERQAKRVLRFGDVPDLAFKREEGMSYIIVPTREHVLRAGLGVKCDEDYEAIGYSRANNGREIAPGHVVMCCPQEDYDARIKAASQEAAIEEAIGANAIDLPQSVDTGKRVIQSPYVGNKTQPFIQGGQLEQVNLTDPVHRYADQEKDPIANEEVNYNPET